MVGLIDAANRELWAVAAHVREQHGESAPVFIADRLGDLALKGDVVGIAVWKAIAARLDTLNRPAPTN